MKNLIKPRLNATVAFILALLIIMLFHSCSKKEEKPPNTKSTLDSVVTAKPDSISIGLIAYWTLAENTGHDFSGRGNDATLYSLVAATDRFANGGGALSFNGNSSYISVNDSTALQLVNTAFSLNAWVYIPDYEGEITEDIINAKSGTNDGWEWFIRGTGNTTGSDPPGTLDFRAGATSAASKSSTTIGLNGWHMVTNTYGLSDHSMKVYIDGTLDKTIPNVTPPASVSAANTQLYIGRQNPAIGPGNYFKGSLSDVRIYNRVISPGEVKLLYKVTLAPTAGLIGYWPLGNTLNDFSATRHDNGFPYSSNGFTDPKNVAASTDRFGNPLGAYKFIGGGGSIDIPQPVSLNTDFTFNTWVDIPGGAGVESIFIQYTNAYLHTFQLEVNAGGNLSLHIDNSNYVTGTQTVTPDTWHMVTCVYTVANGTMKYYVDGVPDTKSYNVNLNAITETDDIILGFEDGTVNFNGSLNDFREYNRALSSSGISQLFHALN